MKIRPFWRIRPRPAAAMVSGNAVTLLHDGRRCFPEMLEAIHAAEKEILLEMYWFASDQTGLRFAHALSDRARAGVDVCVIYDAVGSWDAERSMFESMRAAGCDVVEFNPIAPFRKRFKLGVVNRRDHRKVLVIDGSVAFTGGVNLGDPWAPPEHGGEGWRDDMIRIAGPAAMQLRDLFMHTWVGLGRADPSPGAIRPTSGPGARGESQVQALANFFPGERRAIRRAYLERIRSARKQIYIANSYFVPDRVVRRALAEAARRGVDVRVLVPGRSDVLAVYYAGRRLYEWLMARGIRIYEWKRTILHCKTAVIDGDWCTVGTYNLDYRSFRFNLEANVSVADTEVAQSMRRRFEQDLGDALEVTTGNFRYRSLSERLLENLFYLFRKLL